MTVVYWFWVPELSQLIRMLIHKLMTKIPTSCVTQHLGCQPSVPHPHKDSYLTHAHGVHHLRANSILSLGLSVWNHFQETVLLYNPTSLLSLLKAWPGSPRTRGSPGNAEEHFTIWKTVGTVVCHKHLWEREFHLKPKVLILRQNSFVWITPISMPRESIWISQQCRPLHSGAFMPPGY